ncbi:hypothetical protein ACGO3R_03110 [Lactococcus lactis]
MKLLADLFTPTSGQILINNEDLREIKHKDYWAKISPVFQDFQDLNFLSEILLVLKRKQELMKLYNFQDCLI